MSESLRESVEALPVHAISGYEWECYEPVTGCHWHWVSDGTCEYGHSTVDEGNYDRDGVPCDHQRLVDLDRVLALLP